MATVFLATQNSFERKVALKIIAESALGGREKAEQFMREAKIVGSFSHPHIVPVYDVGRIENFHYLAMDYLQGGDLASWIKSGLKPEESEQIITQVAKALHFAHSKGYIHRDIKPENILFREDNSAVLTDFGIAQPLNASTEGRRLVVGTPAYMSPEQIQAKAIDSRTDLYSLGIMFYEMLTREQPFTADNVKALAIKHIRETPPKLPFPLRRYQAVLDRMLAKDPEQRYDSALAFVKALDHCSDALDMTSVSASIEELKLVDDDTQARQPKGLDIEESSYRTFLLSKRYRLSCKIHSVEGHQFALLFSRFTTRLSEWHDAHGKACGQLRLTIAIDPLIKELVENKVNVLFQEEVFNFLRKLKVEIEYTDLNGKPL